MSTKPTASTLSPRRGRFVEEFLIDFNGAQAAVRAGYAKGSAKVTASRLLTDANVADAIQAGRTRIAEKAGVDAEWVRRRLVLIADGNVKDYAHLLPVGATRDGLATLTREQAYPISEVIVEEDGLAVVASEAARGAAEVEAQGKGGEGVGAAPRGSRKTRFKMVDKYLALMSLGKDVGMFRAEVDVNHSGKIETGGGDTVSVAVLTPEQQELLMKRIEQELDQE